MNDQNQSGPGEPHPWAQWIALSGVIVFVASVVVLYLERNSDETEWQRLLVIWASINSIGLAAVGFFLGREITVKRAEHAEEEASAQQRKAVEADQKATEAAEGMKTEQARRVEISEAATLYLQEKGGGSLLLGGDERQTALAGASANEIRLAGLIADPEA